MKRLATSFIAFILIFCILSFVSCDLGNSNNSQVSGSTNENPDNLDSPPDLSDPTPPDASTQSNKAFVINMSCFYNLGVCILNYENNLLVSEEYFAFCQGQDDVDEQSFLSFKYEYDVNSKIKKIICNEMIGHDLFDDSFHKYCFEFTVSGTDTYTSYCGNAQMTMEITFNETGTLSEKNVNWESWNLSTKYDEHGRVTQESSNYSDTTIKFEYDKNSDSTINLIAEKCEINSSGTIYSLEKGAKTHILESVEFEDLSVVLSARYDHSNKTVALNNEFSEKTSETEIERTVCTSTFVYCNGEYTLQDCTAKVYTNNELIESQTSKITTDVLDEENIIIETLTSYDALHKYTSREEPDGNGGYITFTDEHTCYEHERRIYITNGNGIWNDSTPQEETIEKSDGDKTYIYEYFNGELRYVSVIIITEKDDNGNATEYIQENYDYLRNSGCIGTIPNETIHYYATYDENSRISELVHSDEFDNVIHITYTYKLDENGNLVTTSEKNVNDVLKEILTISYEGKNIKEISLVYLDGFGYINDELAVFVKLEKLCTITLKDPNGKILSQERKYIDEKGNEVIFDISQ